jgi:hypothetical protein
MGLQLAADGRTLLFTRGRGYSPALFALDLDNDQLRQRAPQQTVWSFAALSDGRVLTVGGPISQAELGPVALLDPDERQTTILPSIPRDRWRTFEGTGWLVWPSGTETMSLCIEQPERVV